MDSKQVPTTLHPSKKSSVMEDHGMQHLVDLINSDFYMHKKDPDFDLDKPALIKVCKILLQKINHNFERNKEAVGHLQ